MDDKLIGDNGEDLVTESDETGTSQNGENGCDNQPHQPSTAHSSMPERSFATTSRQESLGRLPLPKAELPKSADVTKPHKSRACPFRQQLKICEKRTLSSSSENLLGDRPRKNFKLCQGFMKRWLKASYRKDSESTSSCCYEKDRDALTNEVHQASSLDNFPQVADACHPQDEMSAGIARPGNSLSVSCTELLKVRRFLNDTQFQLPCTSTEAVPPKSGQGTTAGDSQPREASREETDDSEDIAEDFSSSHLHVNLLPPQVIAHIFSYLTVRELLCSAALVCKHWEHVSRFSCLWIQIKLRDYPNVPDDVLVRLCSRHCSVSLLDLSDCLQITDDGLARALVHCNVLREMYLIRCSQLTEKAFLSVAEHCMNLVHIDVSGCTGLTDKALQLIAEQCPLLQKLRLKQCPLISNTSLRVVALRCPRLKVLTFMDNDKITDAALVALATHSHNLEILCLQNCGIGPLGLLQVTKLHHLKKLDLSNLSTLTPESVKQVARHCRLLDTLNLSLSRDVGDDCISCVAVSCKRLTTLFLISCAITDQALFSIGDNSTLLEHLDVSWCANITGNGAIYVSDHCPCLKYLGLIRCNKVSDVVVERMVEDHPSIHYSTFLLDSKRLIDKAREQGFVMSE